MTDFSDSRRPLATAQPLSPTVAPQAPILSQPSVSSQASLPSIISKALKITGELESSEDIHIEGQVEGDVRAAMVKVGNNARIKGTVYGEEVEVSGTVDGKIEANKVVLTRTAHVSGDVIHLDIKIESGAFIDGHCRPEFGKTTTKSNSSSAKSAAAPREQHTPVKNGDAGAKA